jgi:hypothetical protein
MGAFDVNLVFTATLAGAKRALFITIAHCTCPQHNNFSLTRVMETMLFKLCNSTSKEK